MALTESTYLKQIELACDQTGAIFHVFAERVNVVERDGAVIAQSNHRDSFSADSDEGKAVLGDAVAISVAESQRVHTALAQAEQLVQSLYAELNRLNGVLADVVAERDALIAERG